MSKILFFLLSIFASTSCIQEIPQTPYQSLTSAVSQAQAAASPDDLFALQRASIHDAVDAQSRRIGDLQSQQMWYLMLFAFATALLLIIINYALNNKLKLLRKDFENQKVLIKEKMELLDDTVDMARQRVKMMQKDIDSIVKLARDQVHMEADAANAQISAQLELQLIDAKKSLNEVITHRDKVSDMVCEILASKGSLSPELVERIERQVTETKKAKQEDEYTALDWFLEGEKAKEEGLYAEACELYKKSLAIDPTNADTYNQWGYALYKQGKADEAIKKYKLATEARPHSPKSYNNWGAILNGQGKYKEAIDKLERGAILAPTNANIFRHWGDALLGMEEFEKSLAKFNESVELNPSYLEAYSSWNNGLNGLLEANPTLYPYKVNEFREVLERHNGLETLRNHEEFKYIYKKYFS